MNPPSPKVLLVEDDNLNRSYLARLLELKGFRVAAAATGLEAIGEIQSLSEPPDMALVDIMIPGGTGEAIVDLIRAVGLKSRTTGLPTRVVVYTALPLRDASVEAAIRAGADAVILKPSTIEKTIAVLRGDDPGDVPIPEANTTGLPAPPASPPR